MPNTHVTVFAVCTAALIASCAFFANAGDLNPPAGNVAPTGTTLQEISEQIDGLGSAPASLGASMREVFVRVEGVSGTSLEMPFTDYFEVGTAAIDASRSVSIGGGGTSTSTPSFPCLRIKDDQIDEATIQLLALLASGDSTLVEVVFAVDGGGPTLQTRFTITLDEALIKSVEFDGTGDGATISFVPTGQITYTYIPQTAQGTPGTPVSFCWDVMTNSACP